MRWSPLTADEVNKLLLVASTPVMFISGKRFFKTAWQVGRHFSADMNTLVAVGTGVAYLYSAGAVLFPQWLGLPEGMRTVYFDTATTIITLILMGRLLRSPCKMARVGRDQKTYGTSAKTACVIRDGVESETAIAALIRRRHSFESVPEKESPLTALLRAASRQLTNRW